MEELFIKIGITVSLVFNVVLWYNQRNMVTSKRDGAKVSLHDKKGIIKPNIIAE